MSASSFSHHPKPTAKVLRLHKEMEEAQNDRDSEDRRFVQGHPDAYHSAYADSADMNSTYTPSRHASRTSPPGSRVAEDWRSRGVPDYNVVNTPSFRHGDFPESSNHHSSDMHEKAMDLSSSFFLPHAQVTPTPSVDDRLRQLEREEEGLGARFFSKVTALEGSFESVQESMPFFVDPVTIMRMREIILAAERHASGIEATMQRALSASTQSAAKLENAVGALRTICDVGGSSQRDHQSLHVGQLRPYSRKIRRRTWEDLDEQIDYVREVITLLRQRSISTEEKYQGAQEQIMGASATIQRKASENDAFRELLEERNSSLMIAETRIEELETMLVTAAAKEKAAQELLIRYQVCGSIHIHTHTHTHTHTQTLLFA